MSAVKFEYIWFGASGELRSKVRVEWVENVNSPLFKGELESLPIWNYDGSSTAQASGEDSEVLIRPVRVYKSPFAQDIIEYVVLCETLLPNMEPHPTNNRSKVAHLFSESNVEKHDPMFGIEHEFFVLDRNTRLPLGFEGLNSYPAPQGQYYCSVGAGNAYGREFLQECLDKAIRCGIRVTGSNMEVAPGQMEIQVCNHGLAAADDSAVLKYILGRVSEKYDYVVEWGAKPVKGDWNGSGCHVNFSTSEMRVVGGWEKIMDAINRLGEKHTEHIDNYGSDNHERLTGLHETSDMNTFSWGVANRGCSIRIPRSTEEKQYGYLEDRRPSSSADMYLVTGKLFETCAGL